MENQAGNATALPSELTLLAKKSSDIISVLLSRRCNKRVKQVIILDLDDFYILSVAGICEPNDEFHLFR